MGYDVLMHVWMWQDAHGLSTKGAEFLLDETWRAALAVLAAKGETVENSAALCEKVTRDSTAVD